MATIRMVHLTTAAGAFEARVLMARLGADGIVCHLRGAVDGPLAFGSVDVLVEADDLPTACELLLVDDAEYAFEDAGGGDTAPVPFCARDVALLTLVALGLLAFAVARMGAGV